MDAVGGDELLQQSRRELDHLARGALDDHLFHHAPVIIQVLFGRNAKMKLVLFHAPAAGALVPPGDGDTKRSGLATALLLRMEGALTARAPGGYRSPPTQ